jgi:putative hydrolases of HD superfamily
MEALVNFLFEVGMLKRTPRTGYQFLGTGKESVAEHSFRTAVIGYLLSRQEKSVDPFRTTLLCLFHDLPEARTGDHNYVNKRYVQVEEERAMKDVARDLPVGPELVGLLQEFNAGESPEAMLSRDADQLDLILSLKEQQDLGNRYAKDWIEYAVKRLRTESAKRMAGQILETDSTDWWFEKNADLWVNGPGNDPNRKK